jgi:hypothetical protein
MVAPIQGMSLAHTYSAMAFPKRQAWEYAPTNCLDAGPVMNGRVNRVVHCYNQDWHWQMELRLQWWNT